VDAVPQIHEPLTAGRVGGASLQYDRVNCFPLGDGNALIAKDNGCRFFPIEKFG
jgi:hypothetical protein